eukprot:1188274-Prorocentrum_minimum.AAC.2
MVENLLLLNIIIAMFSRTFEDVTRNAESEWMLEVRPLNANYELILPSIQVGVDRGLMILLHFTGPSVPITARMHSIPQIIRRIKRLYYVIRGLLLNESATGPTGLRVNSYMFLIGKAKGEGLSTSPHLHLLTKRTLYDWWRRSTFPFKTTCNSIVIINSLIFKSSLHFQTGHRMIIRQSPTVGKSLTKPSLTMKQFAVGGRLQGFLFLKVDSQQPQMIVTLASTNRIPGQSACNVSDGWLKSTDANGFGYETETVIKGNPLESQLSLHESH